MLAGLVTVVLTLVGWSSVPLFINHFSHLIDMWTSNGWRYVISVVLWAPLVVIAVLRHQFPRGLWVAAIVPGIFNTLGQITFTAAHYYIDPGLLTFGLRTQIVFATIGAAAFFAAERRIICSPGYLFGLALVVIGSLGVLTLSHGFGQNATTLGAILAISSGLLYACYAISVRRWLGGYHPILAFAVISQYSAVVIVPLMLVFGHDHGVDVFGFTTAQWMMLVASSLIGIALGHVFYFIAIRSLGVAVASGIIQLQPILVSIASKFLLNEQFSTSQWILGIVAFLGAVLILAIQHKLQDAAAGPRLNEQTAPQINPTPSSIARNNAPAEA